MCDAGCRRRQEHISAQHCELISHGRSVQQLQVMCQPYSIVFDQRAQRATEYHDCRLFALTVVL